MDIAFVTGADAGPGLAIARRLIGMGCRVYALASHFARNPYPHDDFIPVTCNLADPAALTTAVEEIVAREGHVMVVVHAARRAAAPLFDAPVADLAERVNVGLLAPLALARATLPWLRKEQGHFVVLAWNGDGPAPGGPVTAAIEGGLHHFAEALFEELRGDGVRATTVYARPNPETAPEAALSLDPQSAVNPELLADAIEQLLRLRTSNVITALVVRPAATAETPRLARSTELAGIVTRDVQLPPRDKFPSEPEPIPTPPRQRPADAPPLEAEGYEDEFDDEEEDDWNPEREPLPWAQREQDGGREAAARGPGPGPGGPPQRQGHHRQGGQHPGDRHPGDRFSGDGRDQGPGQGRRRRRRRGGRGRNREYFGDGPPRQGPPPQGQRPPGAPPPASGTRPQDYPDAEAEEAERHRLRDESYRTPHSEDEGPEAADAGETGDPGFARPDDSVNPDIDFQAPPDDDRGPAADADDGAFSVPEPDERREPQPAGAQDYPAQPQHHPGGGMTSGFGHGHGGRRHRRPGRTPPPGSGRRGPDAD